MFQHVVEKYLNHFGLNKPVCSAFYLNRLVASFAKLPYENATKIIKKKESLSVGTSPIRYPDEVFEDFIKYGAGGTCFSLCYLFWHILEYCGFPTYFILCDRTYGPNTHSALITFCKNQKLLIDPGFLFDKPIAVSGTDSLIDYPLGQIELIYLDCARIKLSTIHKGLGKIRYFIKDNPVSQGDYMKYWLDSFEFSGLNQVVVTRLTAQGQIYLRGNHYKINGDRQNFNLGDSNLFNMDPVLIKKAFELTQN